MSTYRKVLSAFIFVFQIVVGLFFYNAIRSYDGMAEGWIAFNAVLFVVNLVIAIIHISYTLDRLDSL